MEVDLKRSHTACERIARDRARNFYYAFTVLPRAKRRAICAIYAFMRYCDDISDSDTPCTSKLDALQQWRRALNGTMDGDYGNNEVLPAFHEAVRAFDIPVAYFHELIDGAEMDLSISRYPAFDDLYKYCYRVASVVGLVCIHIFGFSDDIAKEYAEALGIGFQLTNILRDVKEDADRNRIYIPLEDLAAAGYSEEDLLNQVLDDRFTQLMHRQVGRARSYYQKGAPLVNYIHAGSRGGLTAMIGIYSALLDRIESREYDVFSSRVELSRKEKLGIAARSVLWMPGIGKEAASVEK